MAKLSLKHIYKIYDNGTKAVDDFNLEIGDNEFIVFVGPSGCGKSTTLRMIAGLEDITAGDFLIDGFIANQLEPKNRDMAMVFQNYALYPHMSVYDNMAFGLKIRHVPKDEIDKRVQEAARILDIQDQLNKKPKEMSGGQKQRVALGRAIVRKPKVFLLDEPLSNLDAKLRSSMRSEITRLHNVLKTTFIYVTHDQVEAMTMGTRIVVMKKGVMQQVDTPMNLYDYPNNIFVAGFIGTPQMNFINARASFDEKNDVLLEFGKEKVAIPHEKLARLDNAVCYEKSNVTIGIRPEHINVAKEKNKNTFEVIVNQVEALGNEANLIVSTLDESEKFTIRIFRDDSLKVGDKILVSFDENKIKLFDKETTNTLLPRIPNKFTYISEINGENLTILGSKVKLPAYVKEHIGKNKKVAVVVPVDAIVPGKDINLKTLAVEKADNTTIYIGKSNNDYVVAPEIEGFNDKQMCFSINLSKCMFFTTDMKEEIFKSIKLENIIPGKLTPIKRDIFVMNKTFVTRDTVMSKIRLAKLSDEKYKAKMDGVNEDNFTRTSFKLDGKKYRAARKNINLFNYSLIGKQFIPDENAIIRIYSLLGRKFALHDINFTISADNIKIVNDGGIEGKVFEIIDFSDINYLRVKVGETELTIKESDKKFKVGDVIHFDLDALDLRITDVNFGVKLI